MKLYKVTVNEEIFALGENELDAEMNAMEFFSDGSGVSCITREVVRGEPYDKSWVGCCPYGSDGSETVDELLGEED